MVSYAGELGRIQAEAAAPSRAAMPSFGRMATDVARNNDDSRRQLEANMAAALALASPQDYRRWLLTYVRHLAGTHLPLCMLQSLAHVVSWLTMFGMARLRSIMNI